MRVLDFDDGFTSATEPLQGSVKVNSLKVFASDADFVTDKGSAVAQGDLYSRSTDDVIRYYDGSGWVSLASLDAVNTLIAAHTNDSTDAHAASAITNTPSGNLAATTVQGALNELQSDVDTRATSSSLASHEADTTAIHGIADTSLLVTTTGAQTVTNKDIDGGTASNTNRIVIPKNTLTTLQGLTRKQGAIVFDTTSLKPYYDDGTTLRVIGSGSESGDNLLTNGDAEIGSTTGWALYNDSAASPVDGTGGTVSNMTFTVSSSSPLRDTSSFVLAKTGAVNIQGMGLSTDFTINNADKSKMLDVEFDYQTISGSFTAGDLKVFIYDVTNASFIAINGSIENSDTILKFKSQFQSSYNSTSYRLIIHVTSSSTIPWNLKLDGFRVSPLEYSYIAPITDEQLYTPTVQGLGTLAASNVNWSQIGDKLYVRGRITIGTPTAVEVRIYFPNTSMIVDSSKITAIQIVGDSSRNTAMATSYGGDWNLLAEPDVNYFTIGVLNPDAGALTKRQGSFFNSGEVISFSAVVPIKGFSSGLKSSTDAGTRPCFAMYRLATAALTANQPINYATLVADSHGAVTTGASWKFTAPFADFYEVTAQGATGTTNTVYSVYKNGTLFSEIAYTLGSAGTNHCANGSVLVPMNAGDYVDVRSSNSLTSTATLVSGSTVSTANYVFIRNVRAQQVIAASESVSCSVWLNALTAVAANGIIIFNSKEYDSHGAFNTSTGTFTAPQAAEYELTSYISNNATSAMVIQIWKNGANYKVLTIVNNSGYGQGTARIKLLAGETITIRSQTAVTYSGSASLSAGPCSVQINKIGNY